MKTCRTLLLAFVVTLFAFPVMAASSPAGNCCGSDEPPRGMPCNDAVRNLAREARDSIRKAGEALMPVLALYRAKMAELHATIYTGADDKVIQNLAKEVERLHSQMLEGRIALQKLRAGFGLPMRGFHRDMPGDMTECPGAMRGPGGKR